jgi:phosphoglycolate phosphatase-like HAD superfamily hydrolase
MWTKLSDEFFRNPKVVSAGRDARDLYLVALCHSNEHLTDGFIAIGYLRRLAADAEIDNAADSAARLVAVGLWTPVEGGWMIHDFAVYNPTKEQVEAERRQTAERKERWKERRSERVPDGVQNNAPGPGPGPGPISIKDRQTDHGAMPPAQALDELQVGPKSSSSKADFVEETLTAADADPLRKHWRQRLTEATPSGVRNKAAYQAKMLCNWLAGDGAPELVATAKDITEVRSLMPKLKGPPPPFAIPKSARPCRETTPAPEEDTAADEIATVDEVVP